MGGGRAKLRIIGCKQPVWSGQESRSCLPKTARRHLLLHLLPSPTQPPPPPHPMETPVNWLGLDGILPVPSRCSSLSIQLVNVKHFKCAMFEEIWRRNSDIWWLHLRWRHHPELGGELQWPTRGNAQDTWSILLHRWFI